MLSHLVQLERHSSLITQKHLVAITWHVKVSNMLSQTNACWPKQYFVRLAYCCFLLLGFNACHRTTSTCSNIIIFNLDFKELF